MNEAKTYFFKPRIGKNYSSGFNGLKTLVLGAYHFCWEGHASSYGCTYYEQCVRNGNSKDYDELCPIYKDRMDLYDGYYRISNSNIIEIDSYTEGERCPSYGEFTRFMTGINGRIISPEERLKFWDSVAFYNYIQHFLPEAEDFTYQERKNELDADFQAFANVIDGLRPDVIYIWTDAIKDAVENNLKKIQNATFKFCKREFSGSLTIWTVTTSYSENQKHTDTNAILNEIALASKKDKMSAAKTILEIICSYRNRTNDTMIIKDMPEEISAMIKSRLQPLIYDDDFVTELTNIYQELSGLNDIANSHKDNILRLAGKRQIYSNFYFPGALPVSGAGPECLTLWGLGRDIRIDKLSGAMMPGDTFLLWIDEDSRLPMTVFGEILKNIRHDGIRHLFLLMKASSANNNLYFPPIKDSCLVSSIYEADDNILIEFTPDYQSTVSLHPGETIPYWKFSQLIPSKYNKNKRSQPWFKTFLVKNMHINDETVTKNISKLLYSAQRKNILFVEKDADEIDHIRCTNEKSKDTAQLILKIRKMSKSDIYGIYLLQYQDIQKMLNTNLSNIYKRVHDASQKRIKTPHRQK